MQWRVEINSGVSQHEIHSRLVLDKVDANQMGLYECEVATIEPLSLASVALAAAGHQQQQVNTGDKLRKLFGLIVNGK